MPLFTTNPKRVEWARTMWLVAAGGLLAYEAYALAAKKKLLSEAVWEMSKDYPVLPFAAGFVNGHFFWQKPETAETSETALPAAPKENN